MEAHPWAIKHSPENYLNSLQNRISLSVNIHAPSRTQELLAEMREFQERNPKLKLPPRLEKALKLFGYRMELEILMKQGQLEAAAVLVTQIRAFLAENDFRINLNEGYSVLILYQCLVHYYLATNQMAEGLKFANLIINTPEISNDYQISVDTQLLRIILLFELKETELFESALQNLYRFLKGQQRLHAFEKAVFDYLKKRNKLPPGTHLRPYLEELHTNLIAVRDDPNERLGLRPFDAIAWVHKVMTLNPAVNRA